MKGIVSIWIPNDLSENEKKEYFNNLLQQLEYHYNEEILSSIRRMESLYRKLFKLNPEFLKELKKAVGVSSSSSSRNTNSRSTGNRTGNRSSRSSSSSSKTRSNGGSNRSSSGSNAGGKYSSDHNVNTTHYETRVSSGSGNCFVATAAYGTPWAEEINILRKWRDKELSLTYTGSLFISLYNKIGPHAANIIRNNKVLMSVTRLLIKDIIKVINKRFR